MKAKTLNKARLFWKFLMVWPTCYEGVLGGKRRNNTGSKSPIGVTLVPFRSDSKMIAGPLKCRAEDSPSQPLNEDTALIDKLFEGAALSTSYIRRLLFPLHKNVSQGNRRRCA